MTNVILQQLHSELKRDVREQLKEWKTNRVNEENRDDSSDTSDSGESTSDTDTESYDETCKVYKDNNNNKYFCYSSRMGQMTHSRN